MNVDEFEQLTGEIIGAAIEVHRVLGPGLWNRRTRSVLHGN